MRGTLHVLSIIALVGFLTLVATYSAGDVLSAFASLGWLLGLICLLHMVPLALHTAAWAALLPRDASCSFGELLVLRWYGESVTNLCPVTSIGGDILRGHLHERTGVPGPVAIGAVIVDLTTEVAGQIAFAGVALALLVLRTRDAGAALPIFSVLCLFSLLVFGFYHAQRRGLVARALGVMRRIAGVLGSTDPAYVHALDRAIRRLYQRRRPVLFSGVLHFVAWSGGALQLYAAAAFLGHRMNWMDVLMLDGLITAVRAAAFMIPAGLGVQEGGFILLAGLVGLSPEVALSLSLIRRVRELVFGIPGAMLWRTVGPPRRAGVINR